MRQTILVFLLAAAAVGCGNRNDFNCTQAASCNLSGGGMCIGAPSGSMWCAYPDPLCPSGYRYSDQDVGDGLAGQCVPEGTTNDDAGVDSGNVTADARPDAPPNSPIVITYDEADFQIGQPDFSGSAPNVDASANTTAKTLSSPNGVCSDGAVLYVVDAGNDRVLKWNPAPTAIQTDAQTVLGKMSFTGGTLSDMGAILQGVRCWAAAGKLLVADDQYRRVMIWNSTTSNGQAANLVLGATSLTTIPSSGATTQSTFQRPWAVWTNGTKVVVSDAAANRVLIWNTFPTANGQAADLVLGQPDFVTGTAANPPTASSLNGAMGVWSDGTRLIIADTGNSRVLIWNTFPTTNGQAADIVLGQQDFVSKGFSATASTMRAPYGVHVTANTLFVADTINDRVLVFAPLPTVSGAAAQYVLGQPDLNSGANNPSATNTSLNNPEHLTVVGSRLYVTDVSHNRVMAFRLNLP